MPILRASVIIENSFSGTPSYFDQWFEQVVKPRLMGSACLIRFADDAVLLIGSTRDAERVMKVLPKRSREFCVHYITSWLD
ncbi:MAG: hypothetical protein ACK5HY_08785, partial [Parahaliea sp.]